MLLFKTGNNIVSKDLLYCVHLKDLSYAKKQMQHRHTSYLSNCDCSTPQYQYKMSLQDTLCKTISASHILSLFSYIYIVMSSNGRGAVLQTNPMGQP